MFGFGNEFLMASGAIVLHVLNYNATAQIEHRTRLFSKLLGRNAIYIYAVYLVISALIRDHFIQLALRADQGSLDLELKPLSGFLFVVGVLLNIWTLKALGVKGMYNGDSFGFLMDAPVTDGPYAFLNEPQYVGTALCLLGSSLYYQSLNGLILTAFLYFVFMLSVVFVEGPHMKRLYSKKQK